MAYEGHHVGDTVRVWTSDTTFEVGKLVGKEGRTLYVKLTSGKGVTPAPDKIEVIARPAADDEPDPFKGL